MFEIRLEREGDKPATTSGSTGADIPDTNVHVTVSCRSLMHLQSRKRRDENGDHVRVYLCRSPFILNPCGTKLAVRLTMLRC